MRTQAPGTPRHSSIFGDVAERLLVVTVANGAVELVPQLRVGSISPAAMIFSVLLAMVLVVVGMCIECRGRCCRGS